MYYHRVYYDIFKQVRSIYELLLDEQETILIDRVLELEHDYQLLLFRMLNRTPSWIRSDRLDYEEIDFGSINITCPIMDVFDVNPSDTLSWINSLKLDELRLLASSAGYCTLSEARKKGTDQLTSLLSTEKAPKQARICFEKGFTANKASTIDTIDLIRSKFNFTLIRVATKLRSVHDNILLPLYFINSTDPVEELRGAFLAQTDLRRYPSYHIVRSGYIFDTRDAFEAYQESLSYLSLLEGIPDAQSLLDTCEDLLESFDWHLQMRKPSHKSYYLRRFSPLWSLAKALEYMASSLESIKEYEMAVRVYRVLLDQNEVCLGRRGDWWERVVLDSHKHLKCSAHLVVELCRSALEDDNVRTGSRWAINKRLSKLQSSSETTVDCLDEIPVDTIEKIPVTQPGTKGRSVQYYFDDQQDVTIGVEALAIKHYQQEGWDVVHSESGVFTMLFAAIFWDILFSSIPDVFQTPFQTCPLDLRTDAFYKSREGLIEERLGLIESGKYTLERLESSLNAIEGISCVGVNWNAYSPEFLVNVFNGLGRKACCVILRSLAMDYRNYSSGMPDLVLWRDGEVMLVEVKSENDKLSDQQRNWLSVLLSNSISVRLCKISRKKNK